MLSNFKHSRWFKQIDAFVAAAGVQKGREKLGGGGVGERGQRTAHSAQARR
jgi:hypothetical protein